MICMVVQVDKLPRWPPASGGRTALTGCVTAVAPISQQKCVCVLADLPPSAWVQMYTG